jgi:heme-degrading monooxygenase HmoA
MVVTRLRLREPSLLDEFFASAAAVLEQAMNSAGNTGADALAEAHDVWWTVTAWADRADMRAFVATEPHRSVIARLDDWCDEATFADWEQDDATLPDWRTCYEHVIADGQAAELTSASTANATRDFPPPELPT